MKIREQYAIYDQFRLLMILFALLLFVIALLYQTIEQKCNRKISTMEKLFQAAMEPVGKTMYIWGGGWDSEDQGASAESTRIGVSPIWEKYASIQDETYNFEEHKWEREKGLDCSGYVAWVLYNTFERASGEKGYVLSSTDMANTYASWGFGSRIKNPKEFLPGDIVSMDGHVWISLGTCADGSVLLVHSSPPGVMICGTEIPGVKHNNSNENLEQSTTKSIAVQLAEAYMSEKYPDWYRRYPDCEKPGTYLDEVEIMRWNKKTLTDAVNFQILSGEEMMEYLKSQ